MILHYIYVQKSYQTLMCHYAVNIEEKYAIYNILFIGYIIYVIFVMSDFLTAYACVRIIGYLGYT